MIPASTDKLPPWLRMLYFVRHHRLFFGLLAFLLCLELLLSAMLPRMLPDTWYLRAYLPWESVYQTRRFLALKRTIEPDKDRGWRNRADSSFGGKVFYDQWGSRSHLGIQTEKPPADSPKKRVLFLGDSRVNGHIFLKNDETMNAYLDGSKIETLNFGTALYRLDQIYLALKTLQPRFQADTVVIGIDGRFGNLLDCHYLPFRYRNETAMPLLKPRFTLNHGKLEAQLPNPYVLLQDLPDNQDMMQYLATQDPCYNEFENFKMWHSTPLLSLMSSLRDKLGAWIAHEPHMQEGDWLVGMALLKAIQAYSEAEGFKVIVLLMPSNWEWTGSVSSEHYQRSKHMLEMLQLPFVDMLALFKDYQATHQTESLNFFLDSVHFSTSANALLANHLRPQLLTP